MQISPAPEIVHEEMPVSHAQLSGTPHARLELSLQEPQVLLDRKPRQVHTCGIGEERVSPECWHLAMPLKR